MLQSLIFKFDNNQPSKSSASPIQPFIDVDRYQWPLFQCRRVVLITKLRHWQDFSLIKHLESIVVILIRRKNGAFKNNTDKRIMRSKFDKIRTLRNSLDHAERLGCY